MRTRHHPETDERPARTATIPSILTRAFTPSERPIRFDADPRLWLSSRDHRERSY